MLGNAAPGTRSESQRPSPESPVTPFENNFALKREDLLSASAFIPISPEYTSGDSSFLASKIYIGLSDSECFEVSFCLGNLFLTMAVPDEGLRPKDLSQLNIQTARR
jgi:hypothetical protein